MSSTPSAASLSTTAAKIAALAQFHPAHATSLGMQILAEDKLKWRMRLPLASSGASKKKSTRPASSSGQVVSALGFILNEWASLLESRRNSSTGPSSSSAYLTRLHSIADELLADPTREPTSAVSVHEAGTAIPDADLDAIIARIPHAVAPASASFNAADDEDDTLTPAQRAEEQQAMDTIRQKHEADAANGVVHQDILTDDLLAAARRP